MKISFNILYDDEIFHIRALKTADLDELDLQRMDILEQEWQDLRDPRPEAQYKIEWEEDKDFYGLARKRAYPENRKRKTE